MRALVNCRCETGITISLKDGDGFMEEEELKAVLVRDGKYYSKLQASSMIRVRDTDGDGKVCFEEYFRE